MKAAVYYGPHDFRLEDVADPQPADTGMVIKVRACGICGSDLHYYQRGGIAIKPGTIMGHEFSGDVIAVGKAVKDFREGDRVTGTSVMVCGQCYWCKSGQYYLCKDVQIGGINFHGAFAEYIQIPLAIAGQTVFQLPANLSYEAGALTEPLGIGVFAADRAEPEPKDIVVLFGAGMIGLAALAALRSAGISRIIVSEPAAKRREIARNLGADVIIDAASENVLSRIMQETDGKGADIAFECSGLRRPFLQALRSLRVDGKLMQVGVFDTAFEFNPVTITTRNLRIIGCFGGNFAGSLQLLTSGQVKAGSFITHSFPLKDINEAFSTQADPMQSIKVMVKP